MKLMKCAAVVAVLVGVAPLAGAVTIAELLASPDTYNGKTVTVTGTVAAALPVGTESSYDLRDGVAKVSIVSRSARRGRRANRGDARRVHALPVDEEEGTRLRRSWSRRPARPRVRSGSQSCRRAHLRTPRKPFP